jgi:Na+-transporting methylmalonyl-CoA/oxaloacetate decarboxylase gamma subunit
MILVILFSLGIAFVLMAVILLIKEATVIRKVIRRKIKLIKEQK